MSKVLKPIIDGLGNVVNAWFGTDGTNIVQKMNISNEAGDPNSDTNPVYTNSPSQVWKWSFADEISGNIDTSFATLLTTGTGMTVNQTGGNLVITTGTTANSSTIIRTLDKFRGNGLARYALTLSQRIANQNFVIEFVDKIADSASITYTSTTTATITVVGHTYTTRDYTKKFWISGSSLTSDQQVTISSVATDVINITGTGFPASGTENIYCFGLNYYQVIYSGTSATALGTGYNTSRNGRSNTATSATINTTASGHIGIIDATSSLESTYLDQIIGTAANQVASSRVTMNQNSPDRTTELYFQIRIFNGGTAPASSTTATIGFISVEMYSPNNVQISGAQPFGKNIIPASIPSGVVINSGTVTTVTSVTTSGTPLAPATPYILNSAASTNGALILTGTSGLHAFYATNTGATAAFVKLYNKATAPTVGTDTPAMILPVPAAVSGVPGVATLPIGHNGFRFALGLGIAITGGSADTDTTAVAAGQVKVMLSRTV